MFCLIALYLLKKKIFFFLKSKQKEDFKSLMDERLQDLRRQSTTISSAQSSTMPADPQLAVLHALARDSSVLHQEDGATLLNGTRPASHDPDPINNPDPSFISIRRRQSMAREQHVIASSSSSSSSSASMVAPVTTSGLFSQASPNASTSSASQVSPRDLLLRTTPSHLRGPEVQRVAESISPSR